LLDRDGTSHHERDAAFLMTRERLSALQTKPERGTAGPPPSLTPGHGGSAFSPAAASASAATAFFLKVDDLTLCEQIAAEDHRAFRRISPHELHTFTAISSAIMFHTSASPAMNLIAFVKRGETLMHWAATEIIAATPQDETSGALSQKSRVAKADVKTERERGETFIAARCQVIAKIIALVYRFVELNDLFAAFSLYSALRHPAVSRLRSTWGQMPLNSMTSLEELHKIFAFDKGYRGYVDYVNSVPDDDVYPLIPVVAVTIDEIRRLCASEPTVLRDAVGGCVLHWRKFDVLGDIMEEIRRRQSMDIPLVFTPHPQFQRWIDATWASIYGEPDDLVKASFTAEPPSSTSGE
jgi:hypothetical protein